ncbi:hypothetical protein EVAR_94395_1 [Eumeta japonica]|uniref:Mariner Mos1 transposase n=1 Tax=Eumeta variegata TaxID=151549 RepID=A0A4C1TQ24_EUMVA|nr:hypothetical protein EVAR_94395_1 [Eumeta japonica]
MLCVWWEWKGIIHYELLPPSKTINLDLYCQQLMRLTEEVEKNSRNSSTERVCVPTLVPTPCAVQRVGQQRAQARSSSGYIASKRNNLWSGESLKNLDSMITAWIGAPSGGVQSGTEGIRSEPEDK